MNYFSHFFLLPNYEDNYLTLGSIFPDLLRDSKVNTLINNDEINNTTRPEILSLEHGINHHIRLDSIFHNSDFFKTTVRDFSEKIRQNPSISLNKYTYFFAHILIELLIDHLLILQYPSLLNRFYSNLDSINNALMRSIFERYLPNNDFELFENKFNLFQNKKFLYNYETLDQILTHTSFIFEKVCSISIPINERTEYLKLIQQDLEPTIDKKIRNLLVQLKTAL